MRTPPRRHARTRPAPRRPHPAATPALLLLLGLLLAACTQRAGESHEERGGTAAATAEVPPSGTEGVAPIRTPEVPAAPDGLPVARIVSLLPSATEMLAALGVGEALVGRTMHCDDPAWVLALPSVGSGLTPDLERLLSLRPDLVVAGRMQAGQPVLQRLRDHGVEVMVLPDERLEDVFAGIDALGERLGLQTRAEEIGQGIGASIGLLTLRQPAEPVRTLIVVGTDPIFAAGRDTFLDDLLQAAGGVNVVERTGWVRLDQEAVIGLRPALLLSTGEESRLREQWAFLRRAVPAVGLCSVPEDIAARQGPRVAEAAAAYQRCILRHAPVAPPE
ncbi:MAG: hypothetical protein EA398_10775 [Deltaproteobacteria bacterium]|nr:MAG: hypothetical protein EA398_10775 [Deltaproteobacteria bacterium]